MTSELALAVASFSAELPNRTKATLEHLLKRDLAENDLKGKGPEMRLGLLLDLLSSGEGEFPTVRTYEEMRNGLSEDWPSASQLVRIYGSWLLAVRAAASLASAGPTRPKKTAYPSHPYSRDEILHSLLRFRSELGQWPTSHSEYTAWATISRAIQLRWGTTHARIASVTVLRRRFGTLESAISAAVRREKR